MATKRALRLPQHIIDELERLDNELEIEPTAAHYPFSKVWITYRGKEIPLNFTRCCDKCGQPTSWNSALLIEEQCLKTFSGFYDRHFYPTESCEGSPSRVECFTGENSEYREKALRFIALSRGIWEIMNKYYPKGNDAPRKL